MPPPYEYIFTDVIGNAEASGMAAQEQLSDNVGDEQETDTLQANCPRADMSSDI